MTRQARMWPFFLSAVVALALGVGATGVWADDCEVEFDEAEVFFEFNASDGDLGIQIFFDATGWEEVEVTGPDGSIFEVENGGGLNDIGSTEVFTESAEPPLCAEDECLPGELEAAIADLLARFPEGVYELKGETVDGCELVGDVGLTHDLPEMVDLDIENFPEIEWTPGSGGPKIVGYEVVAEMEIEEDGEERVFVNTATLPASETSFTVSDVFADLADQAELDGVLIVLKVEVIAREESGNKTITEEAVFEAEE